MSSISKIYQTLFFPNEDLSQINSDGKVQVVCPFHIDNRKSAGVNPVDGYFNCFVCDDAKNLTYHQFVRKFMNQNTQTQHFKHDATGYLFGEFLKLSQDANQIEQNYQKFISNINNKLELFQLGIDQSVAEQLRLGDISSNVYSINIPITMFGVFVGYKKYSPNPPQNYGKSIVDKGIPNGVVIPFDAWLNDTRPTLLCEGEKDMLVARSKGFNAITLTGGCKAPINDGMLEFFKDKEVYIVYDNDNAGREGSLKIANQLYKSGCLKVKNVQTFHNGMLDKEDITDYFNKYGKTSQDLANCITNTDYWTYTQPIKERKKNVPQVHLTEAQNPENFGKELHSVIQVLGTMDGTSVQMFPKILQCSYTVKDSWGNPQRGKIYLDLEKEINLLLMWSDGTTRPDKVIKDIAKPYIEKDLEGVFNKLKESSKQSDLTDLADLLGMDSQGPLFVDFSTKWTFNVDKESDETFALCVSQISPYNESLDDETTYENLDGTYTLITLHKDARRIELGKVYDIDYVPRHHPSKANTLVLLANEVYDREDSLNTFSITPTVKQSLNIFKHNYEMFGLDNTIKQQYIWWKETIPYLNFNLWLAYDLTFNSVLFYNANNKPNIRGVVYTNVIGDTRAGKSELSRAMIKMYRQGKSINTTTATITSLLGGTVQSKIGNYTTLGVIPKHHKALLAFEELHSTGADYFKNITDVKSSCKVSITRVAQSISERPCAVRLLEISNPKTIGGGSAVSVDDIANGIEMINNLIPNAEDIARNDVYIILPTQPYTTQQPLDDDKKSIQPIHYQNRIKWIWSRKPNQIIFENASYLKEVGGQLCEDFKCAYKFLGAEAWEKVGRLAIALAGLVCSTDNTYENIIVKKEHIDFIVKWYRSIYNSPYINLAEEHRQYLETTQCKDSDVTILQNEYSSNKEFRKVTNYLFTSGLNITSTTISDYLGKTNTDMAPKLMLAFLIDNNFVERVKSTGNIQQYRKTQKFNQAYQRLDKTKLIENNIVLGGGI